MIRRIALAAALFATVTLPAQAAPVPEAQAQALDAAREAYRQTLTLPLTSTMALRDASVTTGVLGAYNQAIASVTARVAAPSEAVPFERKALWVRPYPSDVTRARVLEVFDRAQAMGVTEIYLETFYGGQVIYQARDSVFPMKYPGVDIAKAYAEEAQRRGMKLYAWLHTLKWSQAYAKAHPEDLVFDGWGKPATSTEGASAFIVSPSSEAVRERLYRLTDEIAATGDYDGMILDYIRNPIRLKDGDVDETPDPRNFWGYGPTAWEAFFKENPAWDTPEFRHFLKTDELPDETLREAWLKVWKDWLAHEIEELIAGVRMRSKGKLELSMAFFPNYYFHPHDSRLQESVRWFGYFDMINPMCYSYFLDAFPDRYGHYNIDRGLRIIEDGLGSYVSSERPDVVAALSEDPPGTPLKAEYHHRPFVTQLSWLHGRRLEGRYPHLVGTALFTYGWIFPESERMRREGR